MGYDLVVPVSWGDELLAEFVLGALEEPGPEPRVCCTCPRVRRRLFATGSELAPYLISSVAPPVALARYLRAVESNASLRITFIGGCEGARDKSIDAQIAPQAFLSHLDKQGISIVRQPSVFSASVPPDRRRYWSQPGGLPTSTSVAERRAGMSLRVLAGSDFADELGDAIMRGENSLLDLAPAVECLCAGTFQVHNNRATRETVVALEPPRSTFPVIDGEPDVDLAFESPRSMPAIPEPQLTPLAVTSSDKPLGTTTPPASVTDRRRIAVTPSSVAATMTASAGAPVRPAARTIEARDPTPAPPGLTQTIAAPTSSLPAQRRATPTHEVRRLVSERRRAHPEAPLPRPYAVLRAVRSTPEGTGGIPASEVERPNDFSEGLSSAEVPRLSGLIEAPSAEGTTPVETADAIAPVMDPTGRGAQRRPRLHEPSELHRAAQRALRQQRKPNPDVLPTRGRLWGLLAAVVLIVAIAGLLFSIFS